MEKPFSQASENNREPILGVLRRHLHRPIRVLEIGSGTGQHAVHFARALPHLTWQTSDLRANHRGIEQWIAEAGLDNVLAPLELDVQASTWPVDRAGAVFSANTAHIMGWPAVQAMITGTSRLLAPGGLFLLYGPFSQGGRHNSPGNETFHQALRRRDPAMGIRDLDDLTAQAGSAGLELIEENPMPANNRLLVWAKPG